MEDNDKQIKKDMTLIIKENNKLKKELLEKNTIINSIVNQNVTEIKLIKDKYEDILKNLMTSYDDNIKYLNSSYDIYKHGLEKRLRDTMKTHYKLNNEKCDILSKYNDELTKKIKLHDDINEKLLITNFQLKESEYVKNMTIAQLNDLSSVHKNCTNIISADETIIHNLRNENNLLRSQIESSDINQIKEIKNKYDMLLFDSINKQNDFDVQNMEILNLKTNYSKITEINKLLYAEKKDMSIKMTEYINQIDNLAIKNLSLNKTVNLITIEKENLYQENQHYIREYEIIKKELYEINSNALAKTAKLYADFENERQKYITDTNDVHGKNMLILNDQIQGMQQQHNKYVQEKDSQIKSLMDYIKSFTDNQHALFCDMETLKSANNKLSASQSDIDKILSKIRAEYETKLNDLLDSVSKEKNALIENYKETIAKTQETNAALEERLNQTVDALSLSRITIANMRDNNLSLEKKIQTMDRGDDHHDMRIEISSLKEKLDKSVELCNTYGINEKRYELQIKQLQTKCNKLMMVTKNMNDSSLNNLKTSSEYIGNY